MRRPASILATVYLDAKSCLSANEKEKVDAHLDWLRPMGIQSPRRTDAIYTYMCMYVLQEHDLESGYARHDLESGHARQ